MRDATPEMHRWFAEFTRQRYPDVLKLCQRLCAGSCLGPSYAEDLAQDVFFIARKRLDTLYAHPAPVKWLYQTVSYCFKNALHKARRRGAVNAFSFDDERAPEPPDEKAELSLLSSLSGRTELDAALRRLSPSDRLLFEQAYREELSTEQLSREHNQSKAAIQKRLQRLRCRLQKNISAEMSR